MSPIRIAIGSIVGAISTFTAMGFAVSVDPPKSHTDPQHPFQII
jgi:hypothetical protein